MIPCAILLTPLHFAYLAGVAVILAVMVLRLDTPAVCVGFLFLLGVIGLGSLAGGLMTVFNAILYAAKEFMEVIGTIALVTALSKCLKDLGSDYLLMVPMSKIMKTPALTWWLLALVMLAVSLFLWPSPSVALVGAIMLPFAVRSGLNPLLAAMAMNLAGHGFALSYDCIIQGAPGVSAKAAGITPSALLSEARPLFLIMGGTVLLMAFLLNRRDLRQNPPLAAQELPSTPARPRLSTASKALAVLTPLGFLGDILLMALMGLSGGEATSLVGGTALIITCIGAVAGFGKGALEKVTDYITHGFLFAVKIFAPVIIIGAFFFLGGEGISSIMGEQFSGGIMNDWALWLSGAAPLNKYAAALLQMAVGGLTGLDGSGFSGLPLTGSLAQTLGGATGASIPIMAALGQISAIFVGGGTIVPWGLVPVAAICGVSPFELARKNLLPVLSGFLLTFLAACFLL